MIHRLFGSLGTFKELRFKPGLNIVVADRTPDATERQTRNGAGKTSAIELVHFLLGSSKSIFHSPPLANHRFGMEFDLGGRNVEVQRRGSEARSVVVEADAYEKWPVVPTFDRGTGEHRLPTENWKALLGTLMFELRYTKERGTRKQPSLTFRSLFPYFARRQADGGFASPFSSFSKQTLGASQVAVTHLLALDVQVPKDWEAVRNQERALKTLKEAVSDTDVGPVIGSTAELRTSVAVAEDRAKTLRAQLADFRVLPQYHELEREASQLTRELGELSDLNAADERYLDELRDSLAVETPPASTDVEALYREAGVALPTVVQKRVVEVRAFHDSIVRNRRGYLESESDAIEHRLRDRRSRMTVLEARRSEVMAILTSHGALDQFSLLQAELAKRETEAEALRQRFSAAERFESQSTKLNAERARLRVRLRRDFSERSETLNRCALKFRQISAALYGEKDAGSLTITDSDNGPVFKISKHGDRSTGIANMEIFCFDLMVLQLLSKRGTGPRVLIHDSHLFDPVDERQLVGALRVAANLAAQYGFQYIVTLNTDKFPPGKYSDLDQFIVEPRLTDATESGGLFGFRFG